MPVVQVGGEAGFLEDGDDPGDIAGVGIRQRRLLETLADVGLGDPPTRLGAAAPRASCVAMTCAPSSVSGRWIRANSGANGGRAKVSGRPPESHHRNLRGSVASRVAMATSSADAPQQGKRRSQDFNGTRRKFTLTTGRSPLRHRWGRDMSQLVASRPAKQPIGSCRENPGRRRGPGPAGRPRVGRSNGPVETRCYPVRMVLHRSRTILRWRRA